jgi:hypothetical protein
MDGFLINIEKATVQEALFNLLATRTPRWHCASHQSR